METNERKRSLIAAVGQPWMRDLAFGSHVVRHLQKSSLPDGVEVRDLSFNPIAAMQILEDGHYAAVVFVTAAAARRPVGQVYRRRPDGREVSRDEVHAHIGDSVMGSVSLESLLIICGYRRVLPEHTTIVEIEPEDETWGPELSPGAEALVVQAAELALAQLRCGMMDW